MLNFPRRRVDSRFKRVLARGENDFLAEIQFMITNYN